MSDCGCEKARADIEAFVRGEVECCASKYSDVKEHIENCPSCQSEVAVERTLTVALQRACHDEKLPTDLKAQILLKLRAVQREHS